jgi:hypothetical protein
MIKLQRERAKKIYVLMQVDYIGNYINFFWGQLFHE